MNVPVGTIRSRLTSAKHIVALASSSLFSVLTTALALLIIGTVFFSGIQRGMDQALSYGPQSEENALAIAISEMVYGLDSYVAHFSVLEALEKSIHRGADSANDPKILQNLSNGDLINEGIANATSLGPRTKGFIADGGLKTMVYDDVGIVDFIKIAFAAFGFKVQSLYYLFFATLLLSTTAFVLQYWKDALAQILLLCNLFAFCGITEPDLHQGHADFLGNATRIHTGDPPNVASGSAVGAPYTVFSHRADAGRDPGCDPRSGSKNKGFGRLDSHLSGWADCAACLSSVARTAKYRTVGREACKFGGAVAGNPAHDGIDH